MDRTRLGNAQEAVTLNQQDIKALAADSRLAILKLLLKRNHTQTELSHKLSLSVPTVKEHLNALEDAELARVQIEGRKWKYYSLTDKGYALLDPEGKKIMILLTIAGFLALTGITGTIKQLVFQTGRVATRSMTAKNLPDTHPEQHIVPTGDEHAPFYDQDVLPTNSDSSPLMATVPTGTPEDRETDRHIPWGFIIYLAILAILAGCALYYYLKRRKRMREFVTNR